MKKTISIFCAMIIAGSISVFPCTAAETSQYAETISTSTVPFAISVDRLDSFIRASGNSVMVTAKCYYDFAYTAKNDAYSFRRSSNEVNWTRTTGFGTVSDSDGDISFSDSTSVTEGYYYRLQASATTYDGSRVVETVTQYSDSVYVG